jgi:alpha-N-acetylglucosaminidase
MRAFGMTPVLPAFQGNVPIAVHTKFPNANISRVGKVSNPLRGAFACAAWIDALDPLFATLADKVRRKSGKQCRL